MSTGSSVQTLLTSYQPPILQSEWLGTRSVPMDDGAGHRDKSVGHGCELPPSRKDSNLKEGGMYFKINGLNLHLEDRGNSDGLPLVFLHSWAGSARSWKYVVDALPSGLRTITVDHRGWGRSESHSSGFDLADLASDAKEVVKALKLDRYVLVGHSMGGKVAQFIASERPEKLSGLILVAPAMPGPMHRPLEVREGMVGVMNSAALIQQTIDNTLTAKRLSSEVNAQVIEDALGGSPERPISWPRLRRVRLPLRISFLRSGRPPRKSRAAGSIFLQNR